jgi:hypothetical protein
MRRILAIAVALAKGEGPAVGQAGPKEKTSEDYPTQTDPDAFFNAIDEQFGGKKVTKL